MAVAGSKSLPEARRTARAEAAAWIVRLHGPHRTPELEAGFRDWLAANPENGRQFERVTEVWDAGANPVPGIGRVGHWHNPPSPRRWLLAAASVLIAIGAVAWGVNHFWFNPGYATGIGEQRLVRLTDGTRVSLNSDTRIDVTYRDEQRRVRLERGEAFFEVAKDPQRPFIVFAGEHQVKAVGTAFIVRYEADKTSVTLVEGKVLVSEDTGSAGSPVTLSPGQRLTFAGAAPARVDQPPIEAVTAWRRGEVMLDKTALGEAVAEMNRYDQTTLVIDDPRIAALEISGIYHTGDSETFATMIAKLYGLEVVREPGRIRLTARGTP